MKNFFFIFMLFLCTGVFAEIKITPWEFAPDQTLTTRCYFNAYGGKPLYIHSIFRP